MKFPPRTTLSLHLDSNAYRVLGPTATVHREHNKREDDNYVAVEEPGKPDLGYRLICIEDVVLTGR